MRHIPSEIYLNLGFDKEELFAGEDFKDLSGITWSPDRINNVDIKYILDDNTISLNEEEVQLTIQWFAFTNQFIRKGAVQQDDNELYDKLYKYILDKRERKAS